MPPDPDKLSDDKNNKWRNAFHVWCYYEPVLASMPSGAFFPGQSELAACQLRWEAADFPAGSGGGYDVALPNGGSARCQVAVLAGGRGGGRAGLPLRRKYLDNNIGIAAVFLNSSFSVPAARHCWRRFRQGWFYLATLPNGSAVVVFVTLAKFVPPAREGRLTWWLSALATTRIVREALGG